LCKAGIDGSIGSLGSHPFYQFAFHHYKSGVYATGMITTNIAKQLLLFDQLLVQTRRLTTTHHLGNNIGRMILSPQTSFDVPGLIQCLERDVCMHYLSARRFLAAHRRQLAMILLTGRYIAKPLTNPRLYCCYS